jgi:hypothetical protein
MNNEFDRRWKKAAVARFKVLPLHFPGGIEENHEILSIVDVLAEIRIRNLPNTNQNVIV